MRLIDADNNNLRDAIWKVKLDTREKVDGLLDCAPTVEAIPIKWLIAQIEKCQEISNTSKTVGLAILATTIKQWEIENEK